MIRNYIKIALRNLSRNKGFTFINIFGLAAGLATCLLIMIYILDETSYDKQLKDGKRVVRVASVTGTQDTWAALPQPVGWALKNDLPEVEQVARLMTFPDINKMLLKRDVAGEKKQFFEPNCFYTDSTFFQVISYDFIYGDPITALNEPNTVVISDEIATKFFGKENPVGKSLLINTPFGEFNYTVKGVFNKSNRKSHIPANYFLSMRNNDMWNWVKNQTAWSTNNVFYTYVKLKEGVSVKKFSQKLGPFFERRAGAELKSSGFSKTLFVQPVRDIYLRSSIGNEMGSNGSITYLYILGSIGAFILIIACINFMNLSTARSEKRAREVGVRKVMGAEKGSLVAQFMGESFIMCVLALFLALLIAWALMPVLNNLTNKNIHTLDNPVIIAWMIGLTLLTGVLAGLYPAFYLSSFKPISVLKGKILNSFSASAIRKGLVVFQFTISIFLVVAAIVILSQLNLFKNQQLGFNKEQKIVLPLVTGYKNTSNNYTALRDELLKNSAVKAVTCGSAYPGVANLSDMLFYPEGKSKEEYTDVHLSAIDHNYIETLGLQLLRGRSFSAVPKADSAGIILNEAAVASLGFTLQTAVGKKIQFDFMGNHGYMDVIGVVKNFNFESLHNEIKPYGFIEGTFGNKYGYLVANVTTKDYKAMISFMEKAWNKLNPGTPFLYSFIDQDFQMSYEREQRTSTIVVYFTIIAIVIACLGLFGLAAFSAEQRAKEMGIRKVLGASARNVALLLSKDFARLVIIAMGIASPLAWYAMRKWLQGFAYKVHLSWWMFGIAGCAAILIALATVSFQAIKAAFANPIKSLRTE